MTIWDNIYKNYKKGGEAWATLSEEIHPLFQCFLSQSDFKLKYALDIGCGTGKYLKVLQRYGFNTDGVDSSETSIEMTKKELGNNSMVLCVNMFKFKIPKNKYDFIISVSTIHHGTKEQVQNLIDRIHEALADNGKIFITVPDLESGKKRDMFKNHEEVAEGTYVPLSGPEKGLPHSFYTKEKAKKLFLKFRSLQLDLDSYGRWVARAFK